MIKLTDLEPRFYQCHKGIADKHHGRRMPDGTTQWGGFEIDLLHKVKTLGEADGIRFLCPKSYATNGGKVGTHCIMVFFAGRPRVPADMGLGTDGTPQRWQASGTSYEDLVLSPSILEGPAGYCCWHGFVGMSGAPPGWVVTV